MRKPVVLCGGDAVFLRHTSQSYLNRDVIHLMRDYPNEQETLCGKNCSGYDRNPPASPDLNFLVCRTCFDVSVDEEKRRCLSSAK